MLCLIHSDPWAATSTRDPKPLLLANSGPQPERERLRHLIIGSPEGVRSQIQMLHVLNYAEPGMWSQLIAIPESGIVITRSQGEVFSYLLRYRQLSQPQSRTTES